MSQCEVLRLAESSGRPKRETELELDSSVPNLEVQKRNLRNRICH
jgi:hypothetical protein